MQSDGPQATRHLTSAKQRIMDRALRKSVKIMEEPKETIPDVSDEPKTTSSKTARFVAKAVENQIELLNVLAKFFPENDDIQADAVNDIGVYQSVLPILKSGRWPENV